MGLGTILRQHREHKCDWDKLQHKVSVLVPEKITSILTVGWFDLIWSKSNLCAWSTENHEFYFTRHGIRLNLRFYPFNQVGFGLYFDRSTESYTPESQLDLKADNHVGGTA